MDKPIIASLEFLPVVVVAMKPPTNQPAMAAGFVPESPLGPAVVMAVSCALPGQPGLAFAAHLHPDEADQLAGKLQEASAKAREALGGNPELAMSPEVLGGIMEAAKNGALESEEPIVLGLPSGAKASIMEGEAMGMQIQVQHDSSKPPTDEPGSLGFFAESAGGKPILGILLSHADGSQMGGYVLEEQIPTLFQLLELAGQAFTAIKDGAPEGVKPS